MTQLTLELRGQWRPISEIHTTRRPSPGNAASDLAQAITQHCAPLTRLTVSGKAFEGASNFMCTGGFLRFLQAVKLSCEATLDSTYNSTAPAAPYETVGRCEMSLQDAATTAQATAASTISMQSDTNTTVNSLTHLLIQTDECDYLEGNDCLVQYPCANQVLANRACDQLQAFTHLTHLELPARGTYALWEALPQTLQELSLHHVVSGPYLGLLFPNLHTLSLRACSCTELALLLTASPCVNQLSLGSLELWGGVKALADLHVISAHKVLRLDSRDRHGLGAAPLLTIGVKGQQRGQLSPAQLLAHLPVMPAILRCSVHFKLAPLVDLRDLQSFRARPDADCPTTEPCLAHISRSLPSLQQLVLARVVLEGLDVGKLEACSALEQLELVACSGSSSAELQSLARHKPLLHVLPHNMV